MLDKNGKTLFLQEQFPERLKKLRTEHNLSQQKLADIIGISKGALGFYEIGKNSPDILTLTAFAQYFGVSADYLLGLSDNRTTDTNLQEVTNYTSLSETAIRNLTYFKNTPKEEVVKHYYGYISYLYEIFDFQTILSNFFEDDNFIEFVKSLYNYCLVYLDNITDYEMNEDIDKDEMDFEKWKLNQKFLEYINSFEKQLREKYLSKCIKRKKEELDNLTEQGGNEETIK